MRKVRNPWLCGSVLILAETLAAAGCYNTPINPWAYEEGADVVIGGKIYANSIVDFLDRRPYVDYVAHIRLFTSEDGVEFLRLAPQVPVRTHVEVFRLENANDALDSLAAGRVRGSAVISMGG